MDFTVKIKLHLKCHKFETIHLLLTENEINEFLIANGNITNYLYNYYLADAEELVEYSGIDIKNAAIVQMTIDFNYSNSKASYNVNDYYDNNITLPKNTMQIVC